MVAVKSLEEIAKKFITVTPQRATYYETGVRSPGKDWATETAASERAYAQGVNEAIAEKRFSGGVRRAGSEKWQKMAIEKGTARYASGIQAGAENYREGFAPYREVIASITLPAKGARGDPSNYVRVQRIGEALHEKRRALLG